MVGNIADAIANYSKTSALPKLGGGSDDASAGGMSFGDVLKQAAQTLSDTQNKAEQVSMQATVGKANMVDVMTAMNNAQLTLQTVISIRDKLVEAVKSVTGTPV